MARPFRLSAVLLLLMLLTGCWDQTIYERIGFIVNLGIDDLDSEKILVTYTSPVVGQSSSAGGQSQGGEMPIEVNKSEARLLREAREMSNQTSPRLLEGGKIQNILIGQSMAEKDIHEYLEIFERDVKNPVLAWVIIVEGEARELIDKGKEFKNKPPLGLYINQLMEDCIKGGYCPDETVMDYNIQYSFPGLDPVMPMAKLEDDGVRITGTALINHNKVSGKLTAEETPFLMLLLGKKRDSVLTFSLPEELAGTKKAIAVSLRSLKQKTRVEFRNGMPGVKMELKLRLDLNEYTWDSLNNNWKKDELSDLMAKDIQTGMQEVFKKLAEANCDALGIGDKVRAKYNDYWKRIGGQEGWKKIYPQVFADITVKADIVRYGRLN